MIEQVIDEIHECKMIIPGADLDVERVDMMLEHFTNIAAEKSETKSGNTFIMYVNTGPDHFLHAKVYANVASGGAVADLISKTAAPISNGRSNDSSPLARVNKSRSFPMFQMRRKMLWSQFD